MEYLLQNNGKTYCLNKICQWGICNTGGVSKTTKLVIQKLGLFIFVVPGGDNYQMHYGTYCQPGSWEAGQNSDNYFSAHLFFTYFSALVMEIKSI